MIEEWINKILIDSEEMKSAPEKVLKNDARQALTRYGIDRFTLINTGIPNDDVTRLYKSLFVHTYGFLNFIKDISNKIKEYYLK